MRRWVVLVGFGLAVVGCRSLESKATGKWEQESQSNDIFANMAMQGGPKAVLDMRDDHKFALSFAVVKDNPTKRNSSTTTLGRVLAGKWEAKDGEIAFRLETADGRPIEEVKKEQAAKVDEINNRAPEPEPAPGPPPQPGDTVMAGQNATMDRAGLEKQLKEFELQMVPKTPILISGKLNDRADAFTVTFEGGTTMFFGKWNMPNP